ncbi:MAG: LTA synthase family protein [Lachnospiraceae bacterium]|nr:LTA synthase family protein [Candidatus Merdinaster equi]
MRKQSDSIINELNLESERKKVKSNKNKKRKNAYKGSENDRSLLKNILLTLGCYTGCFIFMEMVLHILCSIPVTFAGTVGRILMSMVPGFLITILSGLTNNKRLNKWICFGILEAFSILYLVTYFTDNSFTVFMNLKTLLSGAEDVMTDFSDRLFVLATQGFPCILFFHVPAILHVIFAGRVIDYNKKKLKPQLISLASGVVVYFVVMLMYSLIPSTKEVYTTTYEYDGAIRNLGFLAGLDLDTRYSIFGNPYDDMVVLNNDAPKVDYGMYEDDVLVADAGDEGAQAHMSAGVEDVLGEGGNSQEDGGVDETQNGTSDEEEPEIEEPKEVVYGYNVMAIDYDSLIDKEKDSTAKNALSFINSLVPGHKNQYTGLFEGKNLILITAEAFSKEVIDEERTPTLYRLANKGIVFEDYYQPAWGGSTSTGEFSVLMGTIPVDGVSSIKKTIGHNLYFTIENRLNDMNYFTRGYHNNTYSYYGRDKTHTNFGYEKWIGYGNGMEEGVKKVWPESDLEMMEFTVPQYIDQQPFSIYYMTVSGHCLYNWGGNKMSAKNKEAVQDMDASATIKAYHAANLELEYAMEYLVNSLEEAGIADDTVIVLTADHYPYGLSESTTWGNDKDYLAELYGYKANTNPTRDHSALIIWSGCLEDMEPIVISEPTYSLDIQPTLLNLFGVKYDSRLMIGRDVFSDLEPLVIWNDYDWMTDRGYYEAGSGKFTPFDEEDEVDKDYITEIKNIVKGKMTVSKAALRCDFYEKVLEGWSLRPTQQEDTKEGTGAQEEVDTQERVDVQEEADVQEEVDE